MVEVSEESQLWPGRNAWQGSHWNNTDDCDASNWRIARLRPQLLAPDPLDAQGGGSHAYFNAAAANDGTMVVAWIAYDPVNGALPETGTLQLIRP
jgi:hypothetical protein